MPTYSYRCPAHGSFDRVVQISRRDHPANCPECDEPGSRVLKAPRISMGDSTARRLIDETRSTADAPRVVSSLPPGKPRRSNTPADPRLRRLPRP